MKVVIRRALLRLIVFILVINYVCFNNFHVIGNSDLVSFIPEETTEYLNNPYMGWVPFANSDITKYPHSLVFAQTTWREIEPEKGVYRFDLFEEKHRFSYWKDKGVNILIQINMDYPSKVEHMDIPDWLYNETKDGIKYDIEWGKGYSPNYNNSKLIYYHEKLIAEMAKRYNNDPSVYTIVLGSIGHWGEWHTHPSLTGAFPKTEISDQYLMPYIKGFTKKFLSMRRPYKLSKDYNMGLHNNSFGKVNQTWDYFVKFFKNGYVDYLTGDSQPAMPDFWKTAPSGGEFANYPGLMYLTDEAISETLSQAEASHISWLGAASECMQQDNMDLLLSKIGYHFVLKKVSYLREINSGSRLAINMEWENKGVSPFYFDWPIEVSLLDNKDNIVYKQKLGVDIRKFLPGKSNISTYIDVPSNLPKGTYKMLVSILDPSTNKPGILLQIRGKRSDGRYVLGDINVNSTPFYYKENNGIICFEAENFNKKVDVSTSSWTLSNNGSSQSGNGVVKCMPNNGLSWDYGYSKNAPQLDYNVYFQSSGRYYFWVNTYGEDGSSDSLHMGVDEVEISSLNFIYAGKEPNTWRRYLNGGSLMYADIDKPGIHTVNIWPREDGVIVDKVLISNSETYEVLGNEIPFIVFDEIINTTSTPNIKLTPTPTPKPTPKPTSLPIQTLNATPTQKQTPMQTLIPTPKPTSTLTPTPKPTPTSTLMPTPTLKPTPTTTSILTPTPTSTSILISKLTPKLSPKLTPAPNVQNEKATGVLETPKLDQIPDNKTYPNIKDSTIWKLEDVGSYSDIEAKVASVKSHWASESLSLVIRKGVLSGYIDGSIKPDIEITRAEAVAMLVKAFGIKPVENPKLKFADTNKIPKWAQGYIQVAYDRRFFSGYPDNEFKANNKITRAEMIIMANNAFNFGTSSNPLPEFGDKVDIKSWMSGYITKAFEIGIIAGYTDNTFRPNARITRAETSVIIVRASAK